MSDNNSVKSEITTHTIAQLYIKQGYIDKAIDIYEAILELDPGNDGATSKLNELQVNIATSVVESEQAQIKNTLSGTEAQIFKLEEWLNAIRMA